MVVEEQRFGVPYVYIQETEPTDKTQGRIWYKISTKDTYVADGTNYNILSADLIALEGLQLEQVLAIFRLEVDASLSLQTYETMFLDMFTDADGYDNTIDTGNTTAIFSTDKYKNSNAISPLTEAHSQTLNLTQANTIPTGLVIETKTNPVTLTKITKSSNCTATKGHIYSYTGSKLASADFVGDDATFSYVLASATKYIICVESDGASYTQSYRTSASFPYNDTNLNWIECCPNADTPSFNSSQMMTIASVDVGAVIDDLIIQTNAITIITAQSHHQLTCNNAVAGTGTITYDISFDNGSTYDTDQALNTKNTRNGTTGTQMIIKLNLNGVGVGNTSEANDYAVMLWY